MEIKQDEIKEIKKIGTLNGEEVKLITLKGGFHIGMGKKEKNSNNTEILAVGSHPALISHNISKKFNSFEQTMNKSEEDSLPSVIEFSQNLSSTQKNVLGLDIYAIKKNEQVEFKLTKHNFDIFSITARELDGHIVLEKTEKNSNAMSKVDKATLSKNLDKTIKDYAQKYNLKIKNNF